MKFRHSLALAFSCSLIVALTTPGAWAVPTPPPAPGPVVNSWAVAPIGTNPNEPGSRPNFSYESAPGAKLSDSASIFNYGNTQLTFRVYATDAFNDPAGGFELLTGDKQPTDAGSWVTLPQPNITVAAHTRLDLPFKIAVPPDARPGDHSAAILASSVVNGRGPDGKIVALDRRAGARIYIRVSGPLQPRLTVDNVHTTYHASLNPLDGSADVSYQVRNTGNIRLGAHQRLELQNPFGKKMKQAPMQDLAEVLPGNTVTMSAHFDHVTAAVRVAAQIVASPFPAGDAKAKATSPVSRSGPTWAIPWGALLVVAIVVLAWQGRKRYLSRRRTLAPPDATVAVPGPVAS